MPFLPLNILSLHLLPNFSGTKMPLIPIHPRQGEYSCIVILRTSPICQEIGSHHVDLLVQNFRRVGDNNRDDDILCGNTQSRIPRKRVVRKI